MTSEMYFVRFHPEVTSCLVSRGKTKYATLGMRLWCKYIRNYLLVYQLTSHFLQYLQNYTEFEGEISDLQLEKYELSFETKKYTTSIWARGDENVIGIGAFNIFRILIRTEIVGSNFRFLTLPSPGIKKLSKSKKKNGAAFKFLSKILISDLSAPGNDKSCQCSEFVYHIKIVVLKFRFLTIENLQIMKSGKSQNCGPHFKTYTKILSFDHFAQGKSKNDNFQNFEPHWNCGLKS